MRYISLIVLVLVFTANAFSKEDLPELKTKQALYNIRLISNDGKFTYYQQRSGDLQMSTNYSNKIVMKRDSGTHYLLRSSNARKKVLIEVVEKYHKRLDFFKLNEIFTINFGQTKPVKIGMGKNAKLHLEDRWVSYFHPRVKTFFVKNIIANSKPLAIKLSNKVNPYFTPKVSMPTPDTVFYTDINPQGYMAIQMYTLSEKKIQTVYKSKFAGMRLDYCIANDNIYMGEFSYDGVNLGSSIVSIPLYENAGFQKISTLYQSELPDIGNLICKDSNLYFIKTTKYDEKINLRNSEAARLSLDTNKVKLITTLNFVTNLLKMDGLVLIPFREKYYVAQGKSILNQDSLKENNQGTSE